MARFLRLHDFQVFDGRMEGMKSLNRSSDAILTYSEESGSPVFTISTSLMLSNMSFKSGAKGQVRALSVICTVLYCTVL